MRAAQLEVYAPLDAPKPLGPDIWIVDGPVARMRYLAGSLPFTTRMTMVRLPDGGLWLHSPIRPTPELLSAVAALGPVAALAPNKLHWMALAAWQAAYPRAVTWAAPGVAEKAAEGGFRIDEILGATAPAAWGGALEQALAPGGLMTEAVFLHRASRTLILTDLIENFEASRVRSRFLRTLIRLGGVLDPNGGTPHNLRLTFLSRRVEMRAARRRCSAGRPSASCWRTAAASWKTAPGRLRWALAWTGAQG